MSLSEKLNWFVCFLLVCCCPLWFFFLVNKIYFASGLGIVNNNNNSSLSAIFDFFPCFGLIVFFFLVLALSECIAGHII